MNDMIIEGKKASPFPNWMKMLSAVIGFGLVSYGASTFFSGSIHKLQQTLPYTVIGLGCLFVSGFKKLIYITPQGIVREYRTWGSKGKDLISWNDIGEIFIKEKGQELISTFCKGKKTITMIMDVKEKEKFLSVIDRNLGDIPRTWVE
ncbi:MAG TPA: hypothetical protein PLV56_03105 [Synergistales bacterium]|nr:hypothetical protein [Synergistales bacterium]